MVVYLIFCTSFVWGGWLQSSCTVAIIARLALKNVCPAGAEIIITWPHYLNNTLSSSMRR